MLIGVAKVSGTRGLLVVQGRSSGRLRTPQSQGKLWFRHCGHDSCQKSDSSLTGSSPFQKWRADTSKESNLEVKVTIVSRLKV